MENNNISSDTVAKLQEKSCDARKYAYCPYSNFRVGCALLCEDGSVFTGCNVENASYGLTICAERVAITKAISEGQRKFAAISIAADVKESFIGPCGACRQFLAEFGNQWDVYMVKPDKTWKLMKVKDLLPMGFSPSSLDEERIVE